MLPMPLGVAANHLRMSGYDKQNLTADGKLFRNLPWTPEASKQEYGLDELRTSLAELKAKRDALQAAI